jgi:hypothetical protein
MVRGSPRHTHPRWEKRGGRVHELIIYLIGTVGVAIVIAVVVIMAQKTGWLNTVQTALLQVKLPGLPSVPQAGLPRMLPELTHKVGAVQHSATTLWQRGGTRRPANGHHH